jgi:glutathione S-transferase
MVYAKEGGFPLEPYPRLREWSARVLALPAWQATAPAFAAAAAA